MFVFVYIQFCQDSHLQKLWTVSIQFRLFGHNSLPIHAASMNNSRESSDKPPLHRVYTRCERCNTTNTLFLMRLLCHTASKILKYNGFYCLVGCVALCHVLCRYGVRVNRTEQRDAINFNDV